MDSAIMRDLCCPLPKCSSTRRAGDFGCMLSLDGRRLWLLRNTKNHEPSRQFPLPLVGGRGPGRRGARTNLLSSTLPSMPLEILHFTLMLFRGLACLERTQVATLAGLRIDFA